MNDSWCSDAHGFMQWFTKHLAVTWSLDVSCILEMVTILSSMITLHLTCTSGSSNIHSSSESSDPDRSLVRCCTQVWSSHGRSGNGAPGYVWHEGSDPCAMVASLSANCKLIRNIWDSHVLNAMIIWYDMTTDLIWYYEWYEWVRHYLTNSYAHRWHGTSYRHISYHIAIYERDI